MAKHTYIPSPRPAYGAGEGPDGTALGAGAKPVTSHAARYAADFNLLPEQVWPASTTRTADGEVAIGGVLLGDIAAAALTPVFVLDEAEFRGRCRRLAAIYGAANVHYASKAFLSLTVARWLAEDGLGLDVASGGELALALRADFPAERITMHGNNKSRAELHAAVTAGVGVIVLDAPDEVARLNEIAAGAGRTQPVYLRIKPGVDAHTHEFIATAHEDQKFGFSIADGQAIAVAREVAAAEHLDLVGLHCHIGSQIFDTAGFQVATTRVCDFIARVRAELGEDVARGLTHLDLGGGLGIAYTAADQPPAMEELGAKLLATVEQECQRVGIPTPTVEVEPGRLVAGPSMVTVYTVGAIKDVTLDNGGVRRYISVDGGMSDNIRPSLYGAEYNIRLVNRESTAQLCSARIVGKHCEAGDILVDSVEVPEDLREGDLLAIPATGAYCYAMSSRYNMLPRPAVVAVADGEQRTILRRETLDDLLSLEMEHR